MTLFDAISKAIQGLAALAAGVLVGLVLIVMVSATVADMVLTGIFTAEQASDGIPWEGKP